MSDSVGAARELKPNRWSGFEDGDVDQGLTLAPRPRAQTATRRNLAAPTPEGQLDRQEVGLAGGDDTHSVKSPQDRIRGSNVHIPVEVLEPLTAKCAVEGLSHGEVIIIAIESTYSELPRLIHPPATAGGSLFAARRSHSGRTPTGPVTPLNYRMRQGDFDTLDGLVEQLGASSRTQLIAAALTHYFDPSRKD